MASLAEGANAALDPNKAMITVELEKRRNADGEEAPGKDEPIVEDRPSSYE